MEPVREGTIAANENAGGAESREFISSGGGTAMKEEENAPLFAANEADDLRSKWEKIQINFVDDPREAVKEADGLVGTATKRLEEIFAGERDKLEREWDRGDNVSTEDLRMALQRYRSFFHRLLSM